MVARKAKIQSYISEYFCLVADPQRFVRWDRDMVFSTSKFCGDSDAASGLTCDFVVKAL